jgi:hypothetical protein
MPSRISFCPASGLINRNITCLFFILCNLFLIPTVFAYGTTPGLYSFWNFQVTNPGLSELDMYITPKNDPGPDSNVFWSNQIDGLGGYTGLQSTMLTGGGEGTGKQFLFSLWGATDARTGTPQSAGIGGGSFCTVSGTATDGSAGVQCRYRYEWQVNHTYRFRVTPNAKLGIGWFKSNVTDMTTGISFDIGSIFVKANLQYIPTQDVSQWVEYWDWNSNRTTCLSVAHTDVDLHVEALDSKGSKATVTNSWLYDNQACPGSGSLTLNNKTNTVNMTAGIGQTAQGFFKLRDFCLTSLYGQTDGSSVGSNTIKLDTCPTLRTVRNLGGDSANNYLWVFAKDNTIQMKNNYCLTYNTTSLRSGNVYVSSCTAGAANQQWIKLPSFFGNPNEVFLLAKDSTYLCLDQTGTNKKLTLASCRTSMSIWRIPGASFSWD